MRYTSTRDNSINVSFEDAICSGYAPDGGLFVPTTLPTINSTKYLKSWSKLSYPQLATAMLRSFISIEEISNSELEMICRRSFAGGFKNPKEAVTVKKLGGDSNTFVAELFHGPTFCFKDLGMRFVVNALAHFCTKRKKKTTLVVSTTGDTGPAAVRAVSDAENDLLSILVHYPLGQISKFQRLQLTTVESPNVHVVAFEGGGDDMDAPIKRMLNKSRDDAQNATMPMLCGVNSYNIARPLMQMVHFVWTYLRVMEQLGLTPGDSDVKLDIVLPTGAMGNIAGGYMAKKIGVPLGLLCAGVNANDITHRAFSSGKFHKSQQMEKTLSEAINIQVPYNFERLLFYLTDQNHDQVKRWMTSMESTSKIDLDRGWLSKLQSEFRSARIDDDEMLETIRSFRRTHDYLPDPHTAVAMAAAKKLGYSFAADQQTPVAILATASPCKFEEVMTLAIGEDEWKLYFDSDYPEDAKCLLEKCEIQPTIFHSIEGAQFEDVQNEWEKMAMNIILTQLS